MKTNKQRIDNVLTHAKIIETQRQAEEETRQTRREEVESRRERQLKAAKRALLAQVLTLENVREDKDVRERLYNIVAVCVATAEDLGFSLESPLTEEDEDKVRSKAHKLTNPKPKPKSKAVTYNFRQRR